MEKSNIRFGIFDDPTPPLGIVRTTCVYPISSRQFLATTTKGFFRYEDRDIKQFYKYKCSVSVFIPELEAVVGLVQNTNTFIGFLLNTNDKDPPILEGCDAKHVGVFHLVYSPKSHVIFTVGNGVKVWNLTSNRWTNRITALPPKLEISFRCEFAPEYQTSILNPPVFDYDTECILLPTENGLKPFDINGVAQKPVSLFPSVSANPNQSKIPSPVNTAVYTMWQKQTADKVKKTYLTSDPDNGLCMWMDNCKLRKRIHTTNPIILMLNFLDPENAIFLDSRGTLFLLNIKTERAFPCYIFTKLPMRIYIDKMLYGIIITCCMEMSMQVMHIEIPWSLFAGNVKRAHLIQRSPKLNESARILVITDNSFVKVFSPLDGGQLTAATPISTSQPYSALYDRGLLIDQNYDFAKKQPLITYEQTNEEGAPVRDQLFAILENGYLVCFDTGTQPAAEIFSMEMRARFIRLVKYENQFCYAIAAKDSDFYIYDYNTLKPIKRFTVLKEPILAFHYHQKSGLYLLMFQQEIQLFDVSRNNVVSRLNVQTSDVTGFHEDHFFIGYKTGHLAWLTIVDGELKMSPSESKQRPHMDAITSFSFGDSFWMTSSLDQTVQLWDYNMMGIVRIELPVPIFSTCTLNGKKDILLATEYEIMIIKGDLIFDEKELDPEIPELDNYDKKKDLMNPSTIIRPDSEEEDEADKSVFKNIPKDKVDFSDPIKKLEYELQKETQRTLERLQERNKGIPTKQATKASNAQNAEDEVDDEEKQRLLEEMTSLTNSDANPAQLAMRQKQIDEQTKALHESKEEEEEKKENEEEEDKAAQTTSRKRRQKKEVSPTDLLKSAIEDEERLRNKPKKKKKKRVKQDNNNKDDNEFDDSLFDTSSEDEDDTLFYRRTNQQNNNDSDVEYIYDTSMPEEKKRKPRKPKEKPKENESKKPKESESKPPKEKSKENESKRTKEQSKENETNKTPRKQIKEDKEKASVTKPKEKPPSTHNPRNKVKNSNDNDSENIKSPKEKHSKRNQEESSSTPKAGNKKRKGSVNKKESKDNDNDNADNESPSKHKEKKKRTRTKTAKTAGEQNSDKQDNGKDNAILTTHDQVSSSENEESENEYEEYEGTQNSESKITKNSDSTNNNSQSNNNNSNSNTTNTSNNDGTNSTNSLGNNENNKQSNAKNEYKSNTNTKVDRFTEPNNENSNTTGSNENNSSTHFNNNNSENSNSNSNNSENNPTTEKPKMLISKPPPLTGKQSPRNRKTVQQSPVPPLSATTPGRAQRGSAFTTPNRTPSNRRSYNQKPSVNQIDPQMGHLLGYNNHMPSYLKDRAPTPPPIRWGNTLISPRLFRPRSPSPRQIPNQRVFRMPPPNIVIDPSAVLAEYGKGWEDLKPLVDQLLKEKDIQRLYPFLSSKMTSDFLLAQTLFTPSRPSTGNKEDSTPSTPRTSNREESPSRRRQRQFEEDFGFMYSTPHPSPQSPTDTDTNTPVQNIKEAFTDSPHPPSSEIIQTPNRRLHENREQRPQNPEIPHENNEEESKQRLGEMLMDEKYMPFWTKLVDMAFATESPSPIAEKIQNILSIRKQQLQHEQQNPHSTHMYQPKETMRFVNQNSDESVKQFIEKKKSEEKAQRMKEISDFYKRQNLEITALPYYGGRRNSVTLVIPEESPSTSYSPRRRRIYSYDTPMTPRVTYNPIMQSSIRSYAARTPSYGNRSLYGSPKPYWFSYMPRRSEASPLDTAMRITRIPLVKPHLH